MNRRAATVTPGPPIRPETKRQEKGSVRAGRLLALLRQRRGVYIRVRRSTPKRNERNEPATNATV
jgi:hypothetical protein